MVRLSFQKLVRLLAFAGQGIHCLWLYLAGDSVYVGWLSGARLVMTSNLVIGSWWGLVGAGIGVGGVRVGGWVVGAGRMAPSMVGGVGGVNWLGIWSISYLGLPHLGQRWLAFLFWTVSCRLG